MSAAAGSVGHDELGWCLGVVLRAYTDEVGAVLGDLPHGHRGFQVLATVVHGDQRSQLALAGMLGIDRTVMTYLIDDLVTADLVARQVDPADRRQRRIVATGRGTAVLAELERGVRKAEDVALGSLDPQDRAVLRRLLTSVACSLRQVAPADPCAVVEDALTATA